VAVVVGDDGIAYASRHFIPAMDPKYRSLLKGPYKDEDPLLQYRLAKEWYDKGYVGKDILNEKDHEGKFIAGRAGSYNRAIDTYNFVLNRFKASLPNAELGVWIYSDTHRFNMSKVDGTGFNAWNFLGIPTTSKNIDRVMGFMEWIYNDRAHFDLLTYGIPGRHWIAVGNDKYDYPSGVNPAMNYDFHGYVLTWNTLLMRYPTDMPDFIVNAIVKAGDASAFYKRFDAGFSFVSDSVATEMAKLNDLLSYRRALEDGVVTNIEAEAARVQGLYEEAGFSKVATELERQINAFLKKNPYQGQ
jgi:putative aldouronate transport system substrate-binding protein